MNEKTQWIFNDQQGFEADKTQQIGSVGDNAKTSLDLNEKTQLGVGDHFRDSDDIGPVAGWLVVVKGPGLGSSRPIGVGMNSVGRDYEQRVTLDFGDNTISGSDHLRIIYDDQGRSFLVAPGTATNPTRINGKIVAQTQELKSGSVVELTKVTHVRFIAFCGSDFDWSETEAPEI